MKKILKNIIPELKYLLKAILIAIAILPFFYMVILIREVAIFKNDMQMYLYLFLIGLFGVYLARFIRYVVYRNIVRLAIVQPDIYNESENR